jgi:hypothetical protein
VGDVDWVCLALIRMLWTAGLNMVMCLQVVLEGGKCMGTGGKCVVIGVTVNDALGK